MQLTRRSALGAGTSFLGLVGVERHFASYAVAQTARQNQLQAAEVESHGVSPFGDLELNPDFDHLPYVNPHAPKGGSVTLQLRRPAGNQNATTFNSLNIYALNGDGAAGIQSTFDSLMAPSLDERNALYGLVARYVRYSADRLTYRFSLRKEARFHDGSQMTAGDVAFSLEIMKEKGHPNYRQLLRDLTSVSADEQDVVTVRFSPQRDRDIHVIVASMPIFSKSFWKDRDFEATVTAPILGSGPYRVGTFEQGRFIEFERSRDYWAEGLPINRGRNNFDRVRYEYFRDRQVAFEAFKAGVITFNEELNARAWATGYDFPAAQDGRVKRLEFEARGSTPISGWYLNTRRDRFKDPRVRQAIGLALDFEWINKNILYSAFSRVTSFFENSDMAASGEPAAAELEILNRLGSPLITNALRVPFSPPVSDGSGADRALLRRAATLMREAGFVLESGVLKTAGGQPFQIEFLYSSNALEAETAPFIANLRRLGIEAQMRIVDPVQYARRRTEFDFDAIPLIYVGSLTPGPELASAYGSQAARTPGSQNASGIADPLVDTVIDQIAAASNRNELVIRCRVLDRILRSGHYWVPLWYRKSSTIAYWNNLSGPNRLPKFATGAPETWWSRAG